MAVLLAAAAALPAGCGARTTSDRDLVLIDASEAVSLMEGEKRLFGLMGTDSVAWVDPRSEQAYRAGHVPGAVHLPFQDVSRDHARLRKYDVLVVYGDGYRDLKAEGMSKRLLELGFDDVRTLRGGLEAWRDAGLEVERGAPG